MHLLLTNLSQVLKLIYKYLDLVAITRAFDLVTMMMPSLHLLHNFVFFQVINLFLSLF